MRHLILVLTVSALCAALVGLSFAWQLGTGDKAEPSGQAVAILQRALAERMSAERVRMRELCEHDVRVERLGLELNSLGDAPGDVSYAARSLKEAPKQEIWLALEAPNGLHWLGVSHALPSTWPALSGLIKALEQPVISRTPEVRVLFPCKRVLSQRTLWVVRALPVQELTASVLPNRVGMRWTEEGASVRGSEVLRIPSLEADDPLVLSVAGASPEARTPLPWVLAMMGLAGCLGGLVAYLLRHRITDDAAVLGELERAAERVASGDLSSTIGLRVGGRADQTFQTFDRMTRELKEMRARLAESERAAAFQEIARRIAHEIKNPLLPIQVAMETLRKAHAKQLASFDEIFEESTRTVLDEVRRMERIVREFDQFARLPKPVPGALSLSALVEDVVSLYRPQDVSVEVEAQGELPQVRADREQITQVLINLLQNALDAARHASAPRVLIQLSLETDGVALHVDDNGPGVPAADRERIFEPYVTTKAHGTGLGLAIVKRIVADHGASLKVHESPIGGARFSLVFRTNA